MNLSSDQPAPLFGAELFVNGESVGPAIIDTGGGFEVMLAEPFGLPIVATTEVLAFGGRETVEVTGAFDYSAGVWSETAEGAIVGVSACECNGLGFVFFRRTGAVLGLDFSSIRSDFVSTVPQGGISVPFERPPPQLTGFDSSFILVEVSDGISSRALVGLLDTGTNASVMRRGLLTTPDAAETQRLPVTVHHAQLGTTNGEVSLFDTPDLPDIILGTDLMRNWADRWYFSFAPIGGEVTVQPNHVRDAGGVHPLSEGDAARSRQTRRVVQQ